MTGAGYWNVETTCDCSECGHDLLSHVDVAGCALCPCPIRFSKAEARRVASEERAE